MRLICTINTKKTDENPHEFAYYLTSKGIDNEYEELSASEYHIWIYNEDDVPKALTLYKEYQTNPDDPRYRAQYETAIGIEREKLLEKRPPLSPSKQQKRPRLLSPAPYGPLSICIILTAVILFMWAQIQQPSKTLPPIPGIIQAPLLPPIERALIFDYPTYFQERDTLFSLYTPGDIEEKRTPSVEAQKLIQKLRTTPTWMGFYTRILQTIKQPNYPLFYEGPLFEQISKGEIWRLITPVFLHLDLLHIFFNILWFIILSNQIEFRIGKIRYILFILATGILSNTAQYLMSGPFFMGLSGIICGMAAFIWARQQTAPWEGYLLHRFTLIFLTIFVVGMFFLQIIFFILQILGAFELTIGIANTAHLTGAIIGYLLGKMPFFSIQPRKNT